MRTFSELRKYLESVEHTQTQSVKYHADNFQQPLQPNPLNEESWLSKGYAIVQSTRHTSMKQQIATVLSNISSLCDRGKNEKDVAAKLNILFDVLKESARAARGFAELSNYTINVSLASALLSENLPKTVQSELEKFDRKRR